MNLFCISFLATLVLLPLSVKGQELHEPAIFGACRAECPTAKTNMDAFVCTERLEHDRKGPRLKGPCLELHHEYESWLQKKAAARAQPKEKSVASFKLTITSKGYTPTEVIVPAGKVFTLVITNQTGDREEMESIPLDVIDRPVPPGKPTEIVIGPLKPGRYEFSGENVKGGEIVAK